MRYFPALTGVRGVASLWVFLFHAFQNSNIPLIDKGDLGVDLFFILSGFIIAHIHARDFRDTISWINFKKFMTLRVARIYPLHLLTLVALLAIVLIYPAFIKNYNLSSFSAFNFVGNLFLVHTWLTPFIPLDMRGAGWSWNSPAWSLSAEWLMYFLFPVIAYILGRFRKTSSFLILGLCSLAFYALLEFLNIEMAGLPQAGAEFIAGCTLHFALNHRHEQWRYWNVVAWLAISVVLVVSSTKFLLILAPAAFFALVPALAFSDGMVARFFSCRASILIGEISLSLYLVHWPILQIQTLLLPFDWHSSNIMTAAYVTFLASIIGISFLVYRYFELPMRNKCRKLLANYSHGNA